MSFFAIPRPITRKTIAIAKNVALNLPPINSGKTAASINKKAVIKKANMRFSRSIDSTPPNRPPFSHPAMIIVSMRPHASSQQTAIFGINLRNTQGESPSFWVSDAWRKPRAVSFNPQPTARSLTEPARMLCMGSKRVCVSTVSKDVSEQPIDWQNCAVWPSYRSPKI
jgi:hypothetical protein